MENNIINYGRNLSWISFNGKRTDQFTKYPLFIQTRPSIQIPERDIELIEIPGRSGELVYDKKRFKNITKTYYIASEIDTYEDNGNANEVNYIDRASEIISWLVDGVNDYAELIESYFPNTVYMARLDSQEIMIDSIKDGAIVLQLTFSCKPYKCFNPADVNFPGPYEQEEEYPCYREQILSYIRDGLSSADVYLVCTFDRNSRQRITGITVPTLEDDNNYMRIIIHNYHMPITPIVIKINLGYCDFLKNNATTQLTISLTNLIAYTDSNVNLTDKITVEQGKIEDAIYDSNTKLQITMYGPSYNHTPMVATSDMYETLHDPDDPQSGYDNYSRIAEDINQVKIVFRGEYL